MQKEPVLCFLIFIQSAVDRRCWQQGSGLMPVFEEDEESSDWPGGEEGKPADEARAEENFHNQSQQVVKS